MSKEGIIKYTLECQSSSPPADEKIKELEKCRSRLRARGLIGVDKEGIGFGNLSIRAGDGFIISGSQTGHLAALTKRDYVKVESFDLDNYRLCYSGLVKPSSEALTHAALYLLSEDVKAVIHIHSERLWNKYLNKLPTTSKDAGYGSAALLEEIRILAEKRNLLKQKIFLMAGHKDGVVSFGAKLEEAAAVLK